MTGFNLMGLEPPLRDIRTTMDVPLMSLENKRTEPIHYVGSNGYVKVVAAPNSQIATNKDFDILIYLVSELNDGKNRGVHLDNTIVFHPYRLLKGIGRGTSGRDYRGLAESIRRLRTTTITTSLKLAENFEVGAPFSWIQRYDIPIRFRGHDSTSVRSADPWSVELPDWICTMVEEQRDILAVHPDYFSLRSAVARALYRTARKSVNPQTKRWRYLADTLHRRYAIRASLSRFIRKVCEIADSDVLPQYAIDVISDGKHTSIVFREKENQPTGPIRGVYRPSRQPVLIAGGRL